MDRLNSVKIEPIDKDYGTEIRKVAIPEAQATKSRSISNESLVKTGSSSKNKNDTGMRMVQVDSQHIKIETYDPDFQDGENNIEFDSEKKTEADRQMMLEALRLLGRQNQSVVAAASSQHEVDCVESDVTNTDDMIRNRVMKETLQVLDQQANQAILQFEQSMDGTGVQSDGSFIGSDGKRSSGNMPISATPKKRVRRFIPSWTKEFKWVQYSEIEGRMYCVECRGCPEAADKKSALVQGTDSFRKGSLDAHAISKQHKICVIRNKVKRRDSEIPGHFQYFKNLPSVSPASTVNQTPIASHSNSTTSGSQQQQGMELSKVIQVLKDFASPSLADSWDNVGLLVEPTHPHQVQTIYLTNDLTPPVLEEAIMCSANLIVSYHPPIFAPLKRLTSKSWKEAIIVRCIESRIAVFSPHTSYDCLEGGVNDWLIQAFDCMSVKPITHHKASAGPHTHKFVVHVSADDMETVKKELNQFDIVTTQSTSAISRAHGHCQVSVLCKEEMLPVLMQKARSMQNKVIDIETFLLEKVPKPGHGYGRVGELKEPLTVEQAVSCVKKHLNLDHVRLAVAPESPQIYNVAVCAGSGSSVLKDVKASLYVTGEMSHHEVLHAVYNGTSVILCEHSNTERLYLNQVKSELQSKLDGQVEIIVSAVDADPLTVV